MIKMYRNFVRLQKEYPDEHFEFEEALNRIKLQQIGNAHSAIDNAKSLASMMHHLYKKGNTKFFYVTEWRD